jgi:hypothetical protein
MGRIIRRIVVGASSLALCGGIAAPIAAASTHKPLRIVQRPNIATHWYRPYAGTAHASWLCDVNSLVVGAGFNKTLQEFGFSTAPELFGAIAGLAYLHGCDEVFRTNPRYISGLPWSNGRPTCVNVRRHVPYTARWQNHLVRECLA